MYDSSNLSKKFKGNFSFKGSFECFVSALVATYTQYSSNCLYYTAVAMQ